MNFFDAIVVFFEKILLPRWMAPEWMHPVEVVGFYVTLVIGLLFTVCYTYQFLYVFLALVHPPKKYKDAPKTKRYAAIIAARNEENVLPALLQSLKGQTYPADLIDIYVIADNCTDGTAQVAREMGAIVFERQNKERVGKGYALEYLFDRIAETKGLRAYDAYMVFDADNVLRANYVEEMHKAYCAGYKVLTSYRNSKNYGKNWVSAGYALWFLRESRHLQNPRSIIGSSAAISGTGFLVDSSIIERNGGWKHFLLTEDIEFTADCIVHGERVGYCHWAELFDEQPETFRQSWRQRKRWAKGMFQVIRKYGAKLLKGTLKLRWSCFDMMMNITPAFLLSTVQLVSTAVLYIVYFFMTGSSSKVLFHYLLDFLMFGYGIFFVLGFFALISEWKKIHCNKLRAVLLLFTFPLFMLTYIPISLAAFFSRRVEWKPVAHKYSVSVADVEKDEVNEDRPEEKDEEKGEESPALPEEQNEKAN